MRRPTEGDLDDVFRVHGDPRTDVHDPAGPDADPAAGRRRLDDWPAHWAEHGFGCWAVEDDAGRVTGFAGVRTETWRGRPVLACTTEDNEGSQRTALAAGLVRRRDLEFELDGPWAVVFSENRSPSAPGAA